MLIIQRELLYQKSTIPGLQVAVGSEIRTAVPNITEYSKLSCF